jgi:hypothetical protein
MKNIDTHHYAADNNQTENELNGIIIYQVKLFYWFNINFINSIMLENLLL